MIADFFTFMFTMLVIIAFSIVKIILLPIDLLLGALIPDYGNALNSVTEFFDMITTVIGWVISFSGIPAATLTLLASYLIFKYTVPVQVWFIKLAGKWYSRLKP